MKLLYIGQTAPDFSALKRMFLLGNELIFMDRPSIMFGAWGTIGRESEIRRFKPLEVVPHQVVAPPAREVTTLYKNYYQADLRDPAFVGRVYEGLINDSEFSPKLIHPGSDYGGGTKGGEIIELMRRDPSLAKERFDPEEEGFPDKPNSREGLRTLLRMQVTEASLQVTQGLLVANEIDACPVSDDQTYPKLLALRTQVAASQSVRPITASLLGIAICKAVIPNPVLDRIELSDIIAYRQKTKDAYNAWDVELGKFTAELTDSGQVPSPEQLQRRIAKDLIPKIQDYNNEMKSARDAMFAEVAKGVITKDVPALIIANLAGMNWLGALTAFAAVSTGVAAPAVIDYIRSRAGIQRRHPVSYWLGIAKD